MSLAAVMMFHTLVTLILISEYLDSFSSQLPQTSQVWSLQQGVSNESLREWRLKMNVTTLWTTCWLVGNDSIQASGF